MSVYVYMYTYYVDHVNLYMVSLSMYEYICIYIYIHILNMYVYTYTIVIIITPRHDPGIPTSRLETRHQTVDQTYIENYFFKVVDIVQHPQKKEKNVPAQVMNTCSQVISHL